MRNRLELLCHGHSQFSVKHTIEKSSVVSILYGFQFYTNTLYPNFLLIHHVWQLRPELFILPISAPPVPSSPHTRP